MPAIFCNRTLNMRAVRAIGYDMDYTLIHYDVAAWERRAYAHLKQKLLDLGWPIAHLEFDPELIVRGLVLDVETGNIVKPNRFGYVNRAYHGTSEMDFGAQRAVYSRAIVDLSDPQYIFLNTLFDLSKGCMYAQLVDLLDRRELGQVMGYRDLYEHVRRLIDEAHMEGMLKAEIIAAPERFVELDDRTPLALLDQKHAGKRLLLITNSEWSYTQAMMHYAFDRFLPTGHTWRDLFDVVIVEARKPSFFSQHNALFAVADEERGLLAPAHALRTGSAFLGGSATVVEELLGLSGDQILYVGDHLFSDVHQTKSLLRWRTALVLREIEDDIAATAAFAPERRILTERMHEKTTLEAELCAARLDLQRLREKYEPRPTRPRAEIEARAAELRQALEVLDEEIAPRAAAAGRICNRHWGLLMRAGNDKSLLARQVERHADIYMPRISCFLDETPFAFLRSVPGTLPHDVSENV